MENNEKYITFDSPIPYKELKIYPIQVKDIYDWGSVEGVLNIDKNSIPDPKVISLNYLGFIYYLSHDMRKPEYLGKLDNVFKMVLREEYGDGVRYYEENKKPLFSINGVVYNAKDFDNIINIICEQNGIERINYNISKELRDAYEKTRRVKASMSGTGVGSLEERIACVAFTYHYSLEYIYELSIKRFDELFKRIDVMFNYILYTLIKFNGNVEIKDKTVPKHWSSTTFMQDKNADLKIDSDAFKEKMAKAF